MLPKRAICVKVAPAFFISTLFKPLIDSIKVTRQGKVRRAKLDYLRGLRGKSARIAEKQDNREVAAAE